MLVFLLLKYAGLTDLAACFLLRRKMEGFFYSEGYSLGNSQSRVEEDLGAQG